MAMGCHGFRDRDFVGRRLGTALVCLLVAAAGSARAGEAEPASAGRESAGRLQGSVLVGPELSSRKIRFSLYADLAQPATVPAQAREEQEIGNVVVYFESASSTDAGASLKPALSAMRQEGLSFVPHVLAIQKGSSVDFPNGDAIFHNVFSLSKPASFDLGRYPRGSSRSVRFDKPGIVKVFCHIHSDMSAVIVVLDNPFFAVPDARGRYSIDGVPPGEYTVVGWHERARPIRRAVRIQAGQTSLLDLSIPLTEPAGGD